MITQWGGYLPCTYWPAFNPCHPIVFPKPTRRVTPEHGARCNPWALPGVPPPKKLNKFKKIKARSWLFSEKVIREISTKFTFLKVPFSPKGQHCPLKGISCHNPLRWQGEIIPKNVSQAHFASLKMCHRHTSLLFLLRLSFKRDRSHKILLKTLKKLRNTICSSSFQALQSIKAALKFCVNRNC